MTSTFESVRYEQKLPHISTLSVVYVMSSWMSSRLSFLPSLLHTEHSPHFSLYLTYNPSLFFDHSSSIFSLPNPGCLFCSAVIASISATALLPLAKIFTSSDRP